MDAQLGAQRYRLVLRPGRRGQRHPDSRRYPVPDRGTETQEEAGADIERGTENAYNYLAYFYIVIQQGVRIFATPIDRVNPLNTYHG